MRATRCPRSERRGLRLAARPPVLLLGIVVATAAGCAPLQPRGPERPAADVAPTPSPIELQASLAARNAALGSFQGQGRLEYEGPDGKVRSANMVVVKAPDKVRIDFRSPFSLTYTVATDGSELVAYDRGEKILYRGLPTPHNIGRYTRVPVTLETLALLVRGLPPSPAGPAKGTVRADGATWSWEIPLDTGGSLALSFDREGLLPLEARLVDPAGRGFTATFSEYADVGGLDAAHEIRAELPDGGRVQLIYGVIWRDRTHSDNAFRLEPIAGVREVDMDE